MVNKTIVNEGCPVRDKMLVEATNGARQASRRDAMCTAMFGAGSACVALKAKLRFEQVERLASTFDVAERYAEHESVLLQPCGLRNDNRKNLTGFRNLSGLQRVFDKLLYIVYFASLNKLKLMFLICCY